MVLLLLVCNILAYPLNSSNAIENTFKPDIHFWPIDHPIINIFCKFFQKRIVCLYNIYSLTIELGFKM